MSADWFQAWAAVGQALLSAGAVWAAVWLQDRSHEKRERRIDTERWESVALVARYALRTYEVATAKFADGMDPEAFRGLYEHGDFKPAKKAIADIQAPNLGDLELLERWLEFEKAWRAAHGRVELLTQIVATSRQTSRAVDALSLMEQRGNILFNKATAVERRVAALVGRPAKI